MEQGPVERMLIRQCLADRQPLPDKIRNAPKLMLGSELYWSAFWDLTTCRSTGLSVAPIPWNAIKDYAVVNEFDAEQVESLFIIIRAMDNAYMDYCIRKG